MALAIIPAPDMSGQTAGWQMLADSLRQRAADKRAKQAQYQELILKLSAPDTTEDQQNAILSQDPAQFEAMYGVPLANVGRDVAQFRTASRDLVAPNGMVMNVVEPTGTSKRVLVPHPGGTLAEQRAQAELEQTRASTAAETQRAASGASQVALNQGKLQQDIAAATLTYKKTMRTATGKVPTYNEVQEFIKGNLDLTPVSGTQEQHEQIAEILGQDLADPVGRVIVGAFAQQQQMDKGKLDKLTADTRQANALSDLYEQELTNLKAGLDKNGQPLREPNAVKPAEYIALSKAWTEAIDVALKPLGVPAQGTVETPMFDWFKGSFPPSKFNLLWQSKVTQSPKLAAAIFGNGVADPAAVRADLQAIAGDTPRTRIGTIDFPTIDPKTGAPTTRTLTLDQAVVEITRMRRNLGTSLPPLFKAMEQADPQLLLFMAQSNPLIEQAARAYNPIVAAAIDQARTALAATPAGATAVPTGDPNLDPLKRDRARELAKLEAEKALLAGKAGATPPPPAPAP